MLTMQYIQENRQTPVRWECDVVVAGGGTAGLVAALAAARNGARTILVERFGYVGGTMINGAGPLHSFFNMYKNFPQTPKTQVVQGIPGEIIQRLIPLGGCKGHLEQEIGANYDSTATIIDWEIFKDVILEMLQEAGVKILLHTWVADVVMEGDTLRGLIVESKSGREAILAKVVVDTTGDADVAYRAGVPCTNRFDDSSVGMPFGMAHVDIPRAIRFFEEHDMIMSLVHADKGSDYDNVVRAGFTLRKLPEFDAFMSKSGMWGPMTFSYHEGVFTFINTANLRSVDATDVEAASQAEITLRRQVHQMAAMLKKYIPGFENAYICWTPIHFGVRRTRIVSCAYDLSLQEIVDAARFPDEIALYGFHDSAPRVMIKDGKYYGIPYRALLPQKVESLLVAGRMITSDWEAHMSTRNTVSCMAQGQAAGTAAAMSALAGITPRQLDPQALRQTLKAQGVFLG